MVNGEKGKGKERKNFHFSLSTFNLQAKVRPELPGFGTNPTNLENIMI